jgi:hypothetical protein
MMRTQDWFIVALAIWLLWPPSGASDTVLTYQDPDTGEWLPVPVDNPQTDTDGGWQ